MENKHVEKIAKMVIAQVPQNQIASACGVSEGLISQVMQTNQYKEIEQTIAVQKFQESELINQGWDGIEARGIKRVLEELQLNPDPEFALKSAVVANKAIRRGTHGQNPIPESTGVRAVIHLNPIFAEKLQQNFFISDEKNKQLIENPKDSDFMPAKDVHDLLGMGNIAAQIKDNTIPTSSPEIDDAIELPEMENFHE